MDEFISFVRWHCFIPLDPMYPKVLDENQTIYLEKRDQIDRIKKLGIEGKHITLREMLGHLKHGCKKKNNLVWFQGHAESFDIVVVREKFSVVNCFTNFARKIYNNQKIT